LYYKNTLTPAYIRYFTAGLLFQYFGWFIRMAEETITELKPIRAIDMFCGIGGNSLGAQQAGVEIVAGFDKWDLATLVYKDNFGSAIVENKPLQRVTPAQIIKKLGHIDLILASPECTSHSVARGKRKRFKWSMKLAFQVTRFSEVLKPRWIVIENVPNMQNWEHYSEFMLTLERQGYKVKEQELVASDFGVPQSRKRLFLICDLMETPQQIVPPADVITLHARTVVNLNGTYKTNPLDNGRRAAKTLARAQKGIETLGNDKPFLLVYYGSDGDGSRGWQSLDVPLRTITTLDRFALVKPGENGDGHVMRMLQPPELRAAMGFPDTFKLNYGNRRDKIHMLGNAVCPPVMKTIIESLIGIERLAAGRQVNVVKAS
jgi:DNA (cytosine-5)-methyltransferase 1